MLKLVVSVLKLYLYKCFLGHGMDQIQRATLSLAICVFSAVTVVLIFFFFVGFSGGFRASWTVTATCCTGARILQLNIYTLHYFPCSCTVMYDVYCKLSSYSYQGVVVILVLQFLLLYVYRLHIQLFFDSIITLSSWGLPSIAYYRESFHIKDKKAVFHIKNTKIKE